MQVEDFQKKYRSGYLESIDKDKLLRLGWFREDLDNSEIEKTTRMFALIIDKLKESSLISLEKTMIMLEIVKTFQERNYGRLIFLTPPDLKKYKRLDLEFKNNSVEIYNANTIELLKTLKFYGDEESIQKLVDWLNGEE